MGAVCSREEEATPVVAASSPPAGAERTPPAACVPSTHSSARNGAPAAHATNPFQAASAVLGNSNTRTIKNQQLYPQSRGGETENLPSPRNANERTTAEGDPGDDFDPLGWVPYTPRHHGDAKHQRPPVAPDDALSVSASSVVKPPLVAPGGHPQQHASSVSSASAPASGVASPASNGQLGGAFFNPGQWESMTLAERRASTKAMMTRIKEEKQESQLVAKGWRRSGERRQHMNSSQTSGEGGSSVVSFTSEPAV